MYLILCSLGWPKLLMVLPPSPMRYDYRHAPSYLGFVCARQALFTELQPQSDICLF